MQHIFQINPVPCFIIITLSNARWLWVRVLSELNFTLNKNVQLKSILLSWINHCLVLVSDL
jgi:hypothetical protein